MAENIPDNTTGLKENKGTWVIQETLRYLDKIPWIELNDKDMRIKLHALMEKAWRPNGSIRFSYEPWVVYISFPDYKESLVLRGVTLWWIPPDYTGKGKTFEPTEQAVAKVKNYLERKKIQWTVKTSLADLSSDYESSA